MDRTIGEPSPPSVVKSPRRDRLRPRSTSWLAWGLWLLVVLSEGLVIGFLLANDGLSTRELTVGVAFWVPFLAFATVGAVVLARRPDNRIGWLCWAIGFNITVSFWGGKQVWVVLANQGQSSAWALLPLLGIMAYLGTLLGLVPFLVLLFPTGRLLSRRWRPVAWAIGLVLGLYLTALLLTPGPVDLGVRDNPENPLGVEAAEGLLRLVQTSTGVVAPALVLVALASVVVRFRRARGAEHQQLKWFTFVVVADLILFLGVAERVGPVVGTAGLSGRSLADPNRHRGGRPRVPAVRHRPDHQPHPGLRPAHRPLAAVYAGVVLVLVQLSGGIGATPPSWAIAGATLAAAALFQPARRRIQAVVDRRFNRRKLRRRQDHRRVLRPSARPDRPGHPLDRAACGRRPDHGADPGLAVASTLRTRFLGHSPQ